MSRFAEQKVQAGPGLAWNSALPGRLMLWLMISGQKCEQRAGGPVVVLGLTGRLLGKLELCSSKGERSAACSAAEELGLVIRTDVAVGVMLEWRLGIVYIWRFWDISVATDAVWQSMVVDTDYDGI
ncbi:hypothetical protein HYQ44_015081 [Verticillium longisporum]|nr:hypothetical protein HYQ44_015081 [Verticillium longisporum]